MAEPSLDKIMSDWDAHAARWRLRAYREAADGLLAGLGEHRVCPASCTGTC